MPRGVRARARDESGRWVNTQLFRDAALRYLDTGAYCEHPEDSPEWRRFWQRELERCLLGFAAGGARITGDHYFYLNYCPIRKAERTDRRVSRKVTEFPDFWDGDYNYFWCRDIARLGVAELLLDAKELKRYHAMDEPEQLIRRAELFESLGLSVRIRPEHLDGGFNLIVGKSRRRGYSYKNAAIAVNNLLTRERSLTILNAYEQRYLYPNGIFSMAKSYIEFINSHTGWAVMSDVVSRQNHIRNSFIEYDASGMRHERGFHSEVVAVTCKNNADANRGKDAVDIFIEEAGAFGTPGLLDQLYEASRDCVEAGGVKTGMITVFGTSGDLAGGSADYARMHANPLGKGFLPFDNIWDEELSDTQCGFFHPISWNLEGYYDEQGNSDIAGAREAELRARKRAADSGATTMDLQRRMQEKPLSPREAFATTKENTFPVPELNQQLARVRAKGLGETKGTPVTFEWEGDTVVARPILHGAKPITSLHSLPDDLSGCPVIYEHPVPGAAPGTYKIGYDPVRQDRGTSLSAIIVFKGAAGDGGAHSIMVAEYVGRMATAEDSDRMAEYFAEYYHGKIMVENEVVSSVAYFKRNRLTRLLAAQPDAVISKHVRHSSVRRVYGCHMIGQLKDAGERYVKEWLLSELDYDENGRPVRAYEKIYSTRLLEELISYRRDGNFDLVSALFMCILQVQNAMIKPAQRMEHAMGKARQLLEMQESMCCKRR